MAQSKLAVDDDRALLRARPVLAGTFGKLLSNQGNYTWVLGSQFVYASLGCDQTNLYYRQCVRE